MSEPLRSAVQQGDGPGALREAAALLESRRIDPLADAILELLAGDTAWMREGTLEVVRALRPDAVLLERLSGELSSSDRPARRNAARSVLAAMATPGALDPAAALPYLIRRLQGDPDVDVRILSANALGESHNPRAREALEIALGDADTNVVAAAAEALGELNDPRAVEALIALAERRDFWTGNAAVVALGALADPRAVETLSALTSDPWLAAEAARALGLAGGAAALEPLRDMIEMPEEPRREAIRAAAAIVSRVGVEVPAWLREALRTEEEALIEEFYETGDAACARLLGLAGTARATSVLLEQLRVDPDGAAVVGLELAPDSIRGVALIARLDSATREEIPTLLNLLPQLHERADVNQVAAFLSDERPEVHTAAAETLSRADSELVIPALEELRRDPASRLGVALAYGRLGSYRCTPLLEMLRDPEPPVRAAAAEGMGRCGLATINELRSALRRESDPIASRALVRALGNEGGDEAVGELERVFRADDPTLRFEAVRALGCTGSASAFPLLLEALSDPDPGIRTIALASLGELGDVRAEEPLTRHIDDPDRDRRRVAAAAIERLYGSESAPKLEGALRDADREVRLVAVNALGRLRFPGAAAALERVAEEDRDPLVRHTAASVAAALQDPTEEAK